MNIRKIGAIIFNIVIISCFFVLIGSKVLANTGDGDDIKISDVLYESDETGTDDNSDEESEGETDEFFDNLDSVGTSAAKEIDEDNEDEEIKSDGFIFEEGFWVYYRNQQILKTEDIVYGTIENIAGWYYINNGKADLDLTSVKHNDNGWWYVRNGKVDFSYNGFAQNENGWWYIENGKVTFTKSEVTYGTVNGVTAWWNVKGSKVIFNESIEPNKYGWWYIKDGRVDFGYTGVKNNNHGWWYVRNGKVDFSYNGFAQNENGWWYIENGKVTFAKSEVTYGTVNGVTAWWNVKGSKVIFNESIEPNKYGWWYVKDGKVDFSKTSVEHNEHGWWYVKNGKVNFGYTGVKNNKNGWWYIKNGKVDFTYRGVASNENGIWYILNGKVDFSVYGTRKSGKKTYSISGGKVSKVYLTVPRIINQRTTAFGNTGCGGAAALMALQATGYQLNANYTTFWNTVPKAINGDFRTGYVAGVGITNPAYVNWIKGYAPAVRYSGIRAVNVLPYVENGQAVILLVPSGNTTHFVVAYGYDYNSSRYMIADSWGSASSSYGIKYDLTHSQLDYRLNVAAPRETGTREGIIVGEVN